MMCYLLQHGYLRTTAGDYFIEPVRGHDKNSGDKHPHLIYHKSDLPPEAHEGDRTEHKSCGVDSKSEIILKYLL